MSEQSNDKQDLDQSVDLSRRKLTKVGVAAPVIMTLGSKPVFGAQCLSEMMSGNASADVKGSCVWGTSPDGLSKLGGTTVTGESVNTAWGEASLEYAFNYQGNGKQVYPDGTTYNSSNSQAGYDNRLLKKPGDRNKAEDYIGGTLVSELPFTTLYTLGDPPIRLVLDHQNGYRDQVLRHVLAAYINAWAIDDYVLTPGQVIDLYSGAIPIPGGMELVAFLDTTWEFPAHID